MIIQSQENTYNVVFDERWRRSLELHSPPPRKCVTFEVSPDCVALCEEKGVPLPELPSRGLIGLRAACVRVAHMSGAAEQDDEIHRDEEDTKVMAKDGSTEDPRQLR